MGGGGNLIQGWFSGQEVFRALRTCATRQTVLNSQRLVQSRSPLRTGNWPPRMACTSARIRWITLGSRAGQPSDGESSAGLQWSEYFLCVVTPFFIDQ